LAGSIIRIGSFSLTISTILVSVDDGLGFGSDLKLAKNDLNNRLITHL